MSSPATTEVLNQVLYGPVKIEVASANTFAGAVDIGAANGVKLKETLKISTLENDNAVDHDVVTDQYVEAEWEQNQYLNEAARAIMRGSLDTIENTAGTLVTGATQTIVSGSWVYNQFTPITHQNGDGSTISITSVTGATNGTLVSGTDYFKVKDDNGIYGIIVVDSATVTTEAQNIVIVYNYTPNATTTYYTGGKTEVPTFYIRFTNTDEDGQIVRWTMLGKTNIVDGEEITFPKYNADDTRIKIPVKTKTRLDITLDSGKQLFMREVIP